METQKTHWLDTGPSGEGAWQPPTIRAEVARENTAQTLLWQIGLVLAGALGFVLAVNITLVVLHIS